MSKNLSVGIDVGTYQVKVVVAEYNPKPNELPKVKAVGKASSGGLRHGYIINSDDVVKSIKEAVFQAERVSSEKIKSCYLSVGGISLDSIHVDASIVISRADSEITELDLEKVARAAESSLPPSFTLNHRMLHAIPVIYKVDGKEVLGQPVGLKGSRLDVRMLFVLCLESHLNDLISAVEEAGVEVEDIIASPLAGSLPILSKAQKMAGCVLANIGSETVSIIVYENDIPISLKVFPIGSTDITNDIALGLMIDIEDAEKIKLGGNIEAKFSKKKLDEIVEARLTDIFELIESHLKKIGKNALLPAGIVITGGGSGIETIEDVARALLNLPSRKTGGGVRFSQSDVRDSAWAVSYGLCVWALEPEEVLTKRGVAALRKTSTRAVSWIKKFLP